MSYYRFENTFNDLQDCFEALEEEGVRKLIKESNEYEAAYVKRLIDLCQEIVDNHS